MDFSPDISIKEFEIRGVISLLRRQVRVILYTALILFAFAGLYLMSATQTYTASALILVDPDKKNILDPRGGYPSTSGRENARVDSEVEILRSDAVALAVIRENGLMGDPEFGANQPLSAKLARVVGIANASGATADQVLSRTLEKFKQTLSVRRRGLTYLISVSATSESPQKAAQLANDLSAAYIEQQVQAKISASLAARDVLEDQIKSSQKTMVNYEETLNRIIRGSLDDIILTDKTGTLAELQAQLLAAEQERQTRMDQKTAALAKFGTERQATLQQISAGNTAPDLQQVLNQLNEELSLKSGTQLRGLSAQIQGLDKTVSTLQGQLRRSVLASDLSPGVLAEIYAIQQEAKVAQQQYQTLVSRMHYLQTQARIQIADSRVVSPALEPIGASFPNRGLVLLVALAASMGLGVSMAFLNEYYIGGITSAAQLNDLLQSTTAAVVPRSNEQNSGRLSAADNVIDAPLSAYAESIRKLRAAIDQSTRIDNAGSEPSRHQGKVILVTSAEPDEGKTTTALALARTYAQSGRKTLLIDADLRKPSLHRHLGFEPQPGFLDYLRDVSETEITGSFYARDPASHVALILGATRSEFPTDQLLSSPTFETLLGQAKEVYDVVIIDSPPLLPVVDARYLAPLSDAVVMVVKWAATNQGDLRTAVAPLRSALKPGAAFLPVLTQVRDQSAKVGYGADADGYTQAA